MGTVQWQVQLVRDGDAAAVEAELSPAIAAVLGEVDASMSTYRPDSDVSRFNRSDSTDWFAVSPGTAEVVARSLDMSRRSGGAFDPTVKPLVELWNFGAGRSAEWTFPTDEQIDDLLPRVGHEKVSARLDPPSLRKADAAVQVDLSGIAKGYAVDRVGGMLEGRGIAAWFVEIGGEVLARGRKPDGRPWVVGVERPNDSGRSVEVRLAIDGWAIATSGDYRSFVRSGEKRYSHILSPRTGRPVAHDLAGVSVVAADCMTADAAATALMVAGPQRLAEVARAMLVEYYALERDGARFRVHRSEGFPEAAPTQAASAGGSLLAQAPEAGSAAAPAREQGGASWLSLFIGAAVVTALAVLGLAVGAIFRGRALRGSCGGLGNEAACGLCRARGTDACERSPADEEVSAKP